MQSVRWRVAGHRAQLEPVAAVCLCVSFGDGLGGGIGEERLDGVAAVRGRGYTQAATTTPSGARSEAASASASRPASRPSYPTKILRYMGLAPSSSSEHLGPDDSARHPGESAHPLRSLPQSAVGVDSDRPMELHPDSQTGQPQGQLNEKELRKLLDVGRALVADLDVETVLRHVLETARELTGARYAALGILDEGKEELERFVFVGIDEDTRRLIGPLPRGGGVLGELIRNPEPLRLPDVTQHRRSYGFPPGHPPMTTFLGVPISIRGEAWGNLYLTDKADGAEFDERDEESAIVLAEWAAIAIGNARLYEDVARRRAELERAVRGLEATATVARAVGFETDLERVLELVVKRGRALVDADSLLVILQEGDELRVAAAAGEIGAEAVGVTLRAGRHAARCALDERHVGASAEPGRPDGARPRCGRRRTPDPRSWHRSASATAPAACWSRSDNGRGRAASNPTRTICSPPSAPAPR